MILPRYHVVLGTKRTTVSLNTILAELLAVKLGQEPNTGGAHTAIRHWLQLTLDEADDPGRIRVSQWLQAQVILALVDEKIARQYDDWLLRG